MIDIAIYTRVSTPKRLGRIAANPFLQNPEVQLEPLKRLAEFREWNITKVYSDRMSAAKDDRPAYKDLWADARRGKFKAVMVWRFDRFARSARELLMALEEFRALGIDFISSTENIDTTTSMGRAMFTLVAAFAELERENTRERVLAGMNYAREHGTKSGKPVGRPMRVYSRAEAMELYQAGRSLREIAAAVGVSRTTVANLIAAVPTVPKPYPKVQSIPA